MSAVERCLPAAEGRGRGEQGVALRSRFCLRIRRAQATQDLEGSRFATLQFYWMLAGGSRELLHESFCPTVRCYVASLDGHPIKLQHHG